MTNPTTNEENQDQRDRLDSGDSGDYEPEWIDALDDIARARWGREGYLSGEGEGCLKVPDDFLDKFVELGQDEKDGLIRKRHVGNDA